MTISLAGISLTQVHMDGCRSITILGALMVAVACPIGAWLYQSKRRYLFDAFLCLLWTGFASYGTFFWVALACRLGRYFPLCDQMFERADAMVGVSVSALESSLFAHYEISHAIYNWIGHLMWLSILLMIVTGKIERLHVLLLSFVITLFFAFPIIVLFPAIGPWSLHWANPVQQAITDEVLRFRQPGPQNFIPTGIVAAPSYHVIWMVLYAWALWDYRWLRIPVSIYACLLIGSTMTTGSHFFVDVATGIGVAVVSIHLAKAVLLGAADEATIRANRPEEQPSLVGAGTPAT